MATCVPFQSQLSSILEVLVRSAVAQISKLVDEKCAFLHLEISRKQNENEMLKRRLQAAESKNALLQQGYDKYLESGISLDTSAPVQGEIKFPDLLENSSAPFTVKEESPDDLWISESTHSTGSSIQFVTTSASDSQRFEKNCQITPTEVPTPQKNMDISHSYNPSHHNMNQNFTVKTEKEEDQSGFNQDSCQHSTGKPQPANINSDFTMDERNSQLWSSIMDGNEIDSSFPDFSSVVDEYSNTFSDQTDAVAKAGNAHQVQPHCNGVFNSEFSKDTSQMANFQAGISNNLHNTHLQERESDDRSILNQGSDIFEQSSYSSQQNFQNKTVSVTRGYSCMQCGKTFGRLHQFKLHQQSHKRKRAFWCTVCGKSFMCSSHLRIHHRTHTGEKPFGCSVCGKRFTQQSSLRVHQRTHSGERPYSCSDCGKTFILMHHLKRHKVIHTYNG
ncbi:zinc finger protein 33B-like isoform X2 [Boleophthalmus pectinirostris]|uniref:zinc finger protein 33B-like isoform X2 n=1 Tax=Boleophthalmus pectinirostris TaxID=150288 RepID=UPI00243097A4|nr:zinc finger protein 33B-like isoform X2 [Boleophthalmus pectinirostris]